MRNIMSRFITLPLLVQLLVIILNLEYTQISGIQLRNGATESSNAFISLNENTEELDINHNTDIPIPSKKIEGPYLTIKPKPKSKPTKPLKPNKPKPTKPLKPNKPKPTKPKRPIKPIRPIRPIKPTRPIKPAKPTRPIKPAKPKPEDNTETGKVTGCTTTECYCKDYYDVVILAETSSFSGSEIWMQTFKPFIKILASKFKITKENVHLALVLYASYAEEYVSFVDPESSDKKALLDKIDNITEDDIGKTHDVLYADSLFYALDSMLFEDGTRNDAGKVTILFNYGFDNDNNAKLIPDVLDAYKAKSAHILTIGMENKLNGNHNMYLLAGCQDNDSGCPRTVVVEYEHIFSAAREIKVKICKSVKIENALGNKV